MPSPRLGSAMNRLGFIALIGGAAATRPRIVRAQQGTQRIGILSAFARSCLILALLAYCVSGSPAEGSVSKLRVATRVVPPMGSPHAKQSVVCRTSQILIIEVGHAQAVLINDQFYPVVFGNRRRKSAPGP